MLEDEEEEESEAEVKKLLDQGKYSVYEKAPQVAVAVVVMIEVVAVFVVNVVAAVAYAVATLVAVAVAFVVAVSFFVLFVVKKQAVVVLVESENDCDYQMLTWKIVMNVNIDGELTQLHEELNHQLSYSVQLHHHPLLL